MLLEWVYVYTVICVAPPALLTAGTELKFICCGWFIGEAARAPMGVWDICALGSVMWLNWLIPGWKSVAQCQSMGMQECYIFTS